jgi:hypothetical protein
MTKKKVLKLNIEKLKSLDCEKAATAVGGGGQCPGTTEVPELS